MLTPAFFFWIGGLALFAFWIGWTQFFALLVMGVSTGFLILLVGLLILFFSSKIVEEAANWLIDIFQGFIPIKRLRKILTTLEVRRFNHIQGRYDKLLRSYQESKHVEVDLKEEIYVLGDKLRHNYPYEKDLFMPTDFGNIFRANESYVNDRYQLEMFHVWPRLWLLLSENNQKEVAESYKSILSYAQLLAWGILFSAWVIFSPYAVLISIFIAVIAFRKMFSAAKVFSQLVRSIFDLYHLKLYESLHWPLPNTYDEEWFYGKALSMYLVMGKKPPTLKFSHPK